MDFLDDPFSKPVVSKAPTAGRFQPKAKPWPKKGPSVAVKMTKEPPVTSVSQDSVVNLSVRPNNIVENKSDAPESSFFTKTESLVNPLADGNLSTEARQVADLAISGNSEVPFSNPIADIDLNVDSSLGSQVPRNVIGLPTTVACFPAETPTPDVSTILKEEDSPVFPNVPFASASPLRPCNSHTSNQSVDKTFQYSECYKESIACSNGDLQIDVEQVGAGDFSCLDIGDVTSEGATASGKRAVKFQPKPKLQSSRQNDPAVAASQLTGAPELPSENQHMTSDDSVHARELNTTSDVLHTGHDGYLISDPPAYQPDTLASEDADSLIPENSAQQGGENLGERNLYDAFDSSVKSIDEAILSRNENRYDMPDGITSGFHDNSSSYNRVPDELASNRDEDNGSGHLVENNLQKKKPRKSKKDALEKDKPVRKRKKASQDSDKATEKPPKKFPRATRRKRCVDKSLLEAPEDELDLQRVPIRDLIILAEYKERQAKKEAAAVPPPTNERTDDMFEDLPYEDNETFGYDQDGDASDNPSTLRVKKDTGYFNYQSHMTKEPRARWTKHDTELFYQGICQFGSDLSMIQQLFPGRTRHQIKLKYKKEERQNPMRLHDAFTSRAQDLSQFELVIGRLQEQAAQEAQADREDSVFPTGEDVELPEEIINTHEDVAKAEQNKGVDEELDKHQVESPPKNNYSEEVEFDWSEYKSDL